MYIYIYMDWGYVGGGEGVRGDTAGSGGLRSFVGKGNDNDYGNTL